MWALESELERKNQLIQSLQRRLQESTTAPRTSTTDCIVDTPKLASSANMDSQDEKLSLREQLQSAQAELKLKDTEPQAYTAQNCQNDEVTSLREELNSINTDIWHLQEQCSADRERKRRLEATIREQQDRLDDFQNGPAHRSPEGPGTYTHAADMRPPAAGSSLGGSANYSDSLGTGGSRSESGSSLSNSTSWRQRVVALEAELKSKTEVATRLHQRELWFEQQIRRQQDTNSMPLEALLAHAESLQQSLQRLADRRSSTTASGNMQNDPGSVWPSFDTSVSGSARAAEVESQTLHQIDLDTQTSCPSSAPDSATQRISANRLCESTSSDLGSISERGNRLSLLQADGTSLPPPAATATGIARHTGQAISGFSRPRTPVRAAISSRFT